MKLGLTATVVMVAFAANSLLNRAALEATETGPAAFAALRLLSGALCLSALVILSGQGRTLSPNREMVAGVATLALYMLGFSFAYISLATGTGALILFGGVQITMFLGAVLGGERIPPLRVIGAVLAFGGLAYLMAPGAAQPDPLGAALMIAAAIGWGVFSLIGRRSAAPLQSMAASFLWCTPLGLGLWALVPDPLDGQGVALAVTSGAITSGLGYALWYRILPQLAATRAAVAQLTVPIIAAFAGALILSEPLSLRFTIATLAVLGGVLLALRAR